MANELIANLSGHFEPAKYTNRYREELMAMIQTKISGGEVSEVPERETGKVVDLMEALRASLAATEKQTAGPKKGGGRRKNAAEEPEVITRVRA